MKNTPKILLLALLISSITNIFVLDALGQTIPKPEKTIQKKVYAHLMPWFETPESNGSWGIHWTMATKNPDNIIEGKREIASRYYPKTGLYHSGDIDIIEYQILLMKLAGIDGVLIDWYGIMEKNDYPINLENSEAIIAQLEKYGMEFAIVYEDRTVGAVLSNVDEQVAAVKADFEYIRDKYFTKPNYIHINDQPLLMVFGPVTLHEPENWNEIFTVFMGDIPTFMPLWWGSPQIGIHAKGEYSWVDANSLVKGLDDFYSIRKNEIGVAMGSVFPGFDDYYKEGGWGEGMDWEIDHNGTEIFGTTLQKVLDADIDYIQLVTWNDYGEGTMIEPTEEFGFNFLTALQNSLGIDYGINELQMVFKLYQLRKQHDGNENIQTDLDKVNLHLNLLEIDKAKEILDAYSVKGPFPNNRPHLIPGEIMATNYDLGGAEISYSDSDEENMGNGTRQNEGVDTETIDNIDFVTQTKAGEWLDYTVSITETNDYQMVLHASSIKGGAVRMELDEKDLAGQINIGADLNPGVFSTVSSIVKLEKGVKLIRFYFDDPDINLYKISFNPIPVIANAGNDLTLDAETTKTKLDASMSRHLYDKELTYNWEQISGETVTLSDENTANPTIDNLETGQSYTFKLTVSDGEFTISDEVSVQVIAKQEAYPDGTPHLIPGSFSAVDYDFGGEGVAYHDLDTGNEGTEIRVGDDVDTENGDNGNPNIGWTRVDEWIEYTIDVQETDDYTITFRVASGATTGAFHLEFNGVNKTGTIAVENTGGWTTYIEKEVIVSLDAGQQVMRMVVEGRDYNISTFSFEPAPEEGISQQTQFDYIIYPNPVVDYALLSCPGHLIHSLTILDVLGKEYQTVFSKNNTSQTEVRLANISKGIYFLMLELKDGTSTSLKFIKD